MSQFKLFLGNKSGIVIAYIRPDADVSDGTWTGQDAGTNLFSYIDESSINDSDYIQSSLAANDVCRVSLGNLAGGTTLVAPVTISYRYAKSSSGVADLLVRLMQGTTEIASWTHTGISTTFTTADQILTAPQLAAITNFNNLELEFTANPVVGGTTTVIAPNGMSWTFPGTVTNGTYVNGDVWVYTATTLPMPTMSTPPSGTGVNTKNGGMINPTFNTMVEVALDGNGYTTTMKQGYDGRATENEATLLPHGPYANAIDYDASYNAHTNGSVLHPGDSLVSSVSMDDTQYNLQTSNVQTLMRMACLTVVNYIPEADEFRPPYYGTTKTRHKFSDCNLSLLPNLTSPFNPKGITSDAWHIDDSSVYIGADGGYIPFMTQYEQMRKESCEDMTYFITPHRTARNGYTMLSPAMNMNWYPRDRGNSWGKLACYVLHDVPDRDKFLKRLIQIAIDAYAVAQFVGAAPFSCGAGFFCTPLWLIRFAGLLFNDTGMKNAASISTGKINLFGETVYKWGEQTRTFWCATPSVAYTMPAGHTGSYPLFGDTAFQDYSAGQGGNGTARYPSLTYDVYPYKDQPLYYCDFVQVNSANATTFKIVNEVDYPTLFNVDGMFVGRTIYGYIDGSYEKKTCTAYNGTTRVLTVNSAFSANPDTTDKFIIWNPDFPNSREGTYNQLFDPNEPNWLGTYMAANQYGHQGLFMASAIMGEEASWGGNGSVAAFARRYLNDPKMWENWGRYFDDSTDFSTFVGSGKFHRDIKGFGGSGNGWMCDLWDSFTFVSRDGITAAFSGKPTTGVYVDGSPWVVAPSGGARLLSFGIDTTGAVAPTGDLAYVGIGSYKGKVMVDPQGLLQGMDDRVHPVSNVGPGTNYSAGLSITLPATIDHYPDGSPKTIWLYRGCDNVQSGGSYNACYNILEITVVASAPPANAIKPTGLYVASPGKPTYTTSDINYSLYTPVTRPVGYEEPDWFGEDMLDPFHERPLVRFGPIVYYTSWCPVRSQLPYPAYQAINTNRMILGALSNSPHRVELINRIVRDGLMAYSHVALNMPCNIGLGGFGPGMKGLAFFAGRFLNVPAMWAKPGNVTAGIYPDQEFYHEDGAFWYGAHEDLYGTRANPTLGTPKTYPDNHETRDVVYGLTDPTGIVKGYGIAQGGTADSIQLAASLNADSGNPSLFYNMEITAGTGAGQQAEMIHYNDTTKQLLVAPFQAFTDGGGKVQTSGASTITLQADKSPSIIAGDHIFIWSGTGEGQMRTVASSGWNSSTKVATITAPWTTQPDNTSYYQVRRGSAFSPAPASGSAYQHHNAATYQIIGSQSCSGLAIALVLAGEVGRWGYDSFFAYLKRWIDEEGQVRPPAPLIWNSSNYDSVKWGDTTNWTKLFYDVAEPLWPTGGLRGVQARAYAGSFSITGAEFTENGVTFNGSTWLTKSTQLAASDSKTALIFVSVSFAAVVGADPNYLISQQGGISGIARHPALAGATSVVWRDDAGAAPVVMNGSTVIGAERANFLISLDANTGTSKIRVWRAGAWVNDGVDDTSSGTNNFEFTVGSSSFAIGSREGVFPFSGLMYRAAMWTGLSAPDAGNSTIQNYFCNPTTGVLVNPTTSQTNLGTPLFDFYGNAAQWNALTANHGSSTGWVWTGAVT
jgi:hypothetical protein